MQNSIYYKTCSQCSEVFSVRYFSRHVCGCRTQASEVSNESPENSDDNLQNEQSDFQEKNSDIEIEDIIDDLGCENREDFRDDGLNYANEVFFDIYEESILANCLENTSPVDSLIRWMLIFLAKWQKSFNITDSSLQVLLKFLAIYMNIILKEKMDDISINLFSKSFPKTIYSFRKSLSLHLHNFEKYVVCIKCNSLYQLNECIISHGGEKYSRKCSYTKYPEHPQSQHRQKCGQFLMKRDFTSPQQFVPYKTFCYRPIKETLKSLVERPDFEILSEKWRNHNSFENLLADVYDGNVWKTFMKDGQWFFGVERNYGIMLNCDWFQPFKHISNFSIGAIYAVFLNLPRHIRFKRENIALLGIIPDMPKEPPTNTFLEPFVEELKESWDTGFFLKSSITNKEECFHLALICVGCDIPASRKLCGFLGHSASRGCSKCNKLFPGQIGERNYGGFDMNLWEPRTTQDHRKQMTDIVAAKTKQEQNQLESLYGTRFSILALLPYFDTVRMNVIDPMHNLFLGTTKNLLKIWKEKGYLNKVSLQDIQEKADSFIMPSELGKAPRKIISGFDSFNADEFTNWTLVFSIVCLRKIIPKNDLECFRKFVLACFYLCRKVISKNDITIAHGLLLQFCKSFEVLYGQQRVTPNMHLHLHLRDCIFDFGPIYSFWLFSFERYNGMLGNIPNNKRNIEVQIMSRFSTENFVSNIPMPQQFSDDFMSIFNLLEGKDTPRGTLLDIESRNFLEVVRTSSRFTDPCTNAWYEHSETIFPLQEMQVCSFTNLEANFLMDVYKYLYPNIAIVEDSFSCAYEKVHDIKVLGTRYSSNSSRNSSSSFVMAFWPHVNGNILTYNDMNLVPHPGTVKYFLKHTLMIENKAFVHWFACVDWFLPVDDSIRYKFGKPIEVWYRSLHIQNGPASYVPVHRIYSKFIHSKYEYRSKDLMVVIPRVFSSMS